MPHFRNPPDMARLPRPVFARKETLAADSVSRAHVHPWAQLSWACAGALIVRTPAASHVAPPQRAVWVPPGLRHEVLNPGLTEMRSLYIEPRAASFAPARCRVLTVTPLARELIQTFSALPAGYDVDGPEGRLVAVLLDQLAGLAEADFSLPWPTDARLLPLCQTLFDTPDDRRNMTAWAKAAGLTTRTLGRLFLAQTGLTFGRWRRRARLLAALAILENGGGVTEAALSCGYDTPSAFIAAFKAAFGVTPGNFAS